MQSIARIRDELGLPRDEVARRTRTIWRKLEPSLKKMPTARSIGAKLGEFERGKKEGLRWWRRRAAAQHALAQVYGVHVGELGLGSPSTSNEKVHRFDDFRALRPFDPAKEEPCSVDEVGWFHLPSKLNPTWLIAPRGAGRSYVAYWHLIRGTAVVERVPRLVDARLVPADGRPLLIDLDGADPEGDPAAIERLAQLGNVLVLAPFLPDYVAASAIDPANPLGRVFDERPKSSVTWQVVRWRSAADWRHRFVHWVAARVQGETLLEPDAFLRWLLSVDPNQQLFQTPGDLLPICALAHEIGEAKLKHWSRKQLAEEWIRSAVRRYRADIPDGGRWLASSVVDIFRSLVTGRLAHQTHAWSGGLTSSEWSEMLPSSLAPAPSPEEVQLRLNAIATPAKRKDRELEKRAALDALIPRRRDAIDHLIAARLLRVHQGGRLELCPRWVTEVIASEYVAAEVQAKDPPTWGRWAVDSERRILVEAQLLNLPERAFVRTMERALRSFDQEVLGCVGAVESLFVAAAGRLRTGTLNADPALLHQLRRRQQQLLQKRYEVTPPVPITRAGPGDWGKEGAGWLAHCWTWSFSLPPPAEAIDPELEWFYPGWATLSLAAPPPWVGRLGDATELIELSPNVIPRCADRDLPNDTPAFLIVAAVLAAEERGWKIQHAHVMLLMYIEVTPYFIGAVATLSEKSQRWLGRAVWRAWLHDPESKGLIDLIHRLKTHSGLMWTFVEKWIEAEDVESVLRERGCSNLKVLLDILPARFRATAIRCALEAKSPEINVLLFDDKAWRTEDADVLLMIADARLDDWSALRALWRAAPERALARTQEVFHRGEDASHWFFLAPDVFLPSMLELLEEKPPLGPGSAWAKKYLALTLLRSPAYADRIYRLLRRLS